MLTILFLFCFGLISAQNICENSPYTVVQLQGILTTALESLGNLIQNPRDQYTPNLVVKQNWLTPNKKPCNRTLGQVENCGYPLVFVTAPAADQGEIPSTWKFVSNPSVAYSGALTNSTKILFPDDPVTFADVAFTIDYSEAVIWFGCTPKSTYFAHSKLLWALRPPVTDPSNQLLGGIGDTLNNFNLNSARVNTAVAGGGATLLIWTASQTTADTISKAFVKANFPATAINVDPFPVNLVETGPQGGVWGLGSRTSNLTDAESAYLATPVTGYFAQAQAHFPYIRLTPSYPHTQDKWNPPAGALSSWRPKVDQSNTVPPFTAFSGAESVYEPHLWGAVLKLIGALSNTQILTPPTGLKFNIFPQTASLFEEFGEQYIFEQKYKQKGGTGTRDNNYYFWNPALVPKYAPTNVSILVGLRHESPNWALFGRPLGHALFWNVVFNDETLLGSLGGIKNADTTLQNFNSLNQQILGTGNDPANLIYARVVGGSAATIAPIQHALATLGFQIPHDNDIQGIYPLVPLHHTYVNPYSGVAPWYADIITPVQIHIVASPA